MKSNSIVKNLVMAAVCLALCYVLPFLTGQIPQIGGMLSPMHIPVLLCGLICGWPYALVVGAVAPILRSLTLGMPPLFPTAAAMCFELAAYGLFARLIYTLLRKKTKLPDMADIYVALVSAMLLGRVVWGVAMCALMGISGKSFTFDAFLAGAFVNAVPGIIVHIALIPLIVFALKKAKVIK